MWIGLPTGELIQVAHIESVYADFGNTYIKLRSGDIYHVQGDRREAIRAFVTSSKSSYFEL